MTLWTSRQQHADIQNRRRVQEAYNVIRDERDWSLQRRLGYLDGRIVGLTIGIALGFAIAWSLYFVLWLVS